MKKINISSYYIFLIGFLLTTNLFCQDNREETSLQNTIQLPSPNHKSNTSVEEALLNRRSVRGYNGEQLSLPEVSQILWSAQGITDTAEGLRTAPSAGALYPLEIYLVAANVKDLNPGIYKYSPQDHSLKKISEGDKRTEISNASLKQESLSSSSAIVVITAIYERTSVKYGKRTERYVNMEVGHVGQNIYLQAISLGLGTVMVGAFEDDALKKVLSLPDNEQPLALYPLGKYK
jgi:SagB-type dehydrogenase family enzyme